MKRLLVLLLALMLLAACGTATPTPSVATPQPTTAAPAATATPPPVAGNTATAAPAGAVRTPTATVASTPAVTGQGTATARATPPRNVVNVTAVPNTSPASAEALIEQAVGDLLDNYVNSLQSNALYQAAYDGAVGTLRESGKTPQPQPPTLTGDRKKDA